MYEFATRKLRWLYCLTLVIGISPVPISRIWWFFEAALAGANLAIIVALLPFIVGVYRIVTVVKMESALGAFVPSLSIRMLRKIGIGGMTIVPFGAALLILIALIGLKVDGREAMGGLSLVGIYYLQYLPGIAIPSLLFFELSRLLGFERKLEARLNRPVVAKSVPREAAGK